MKTKWTRAEIDDYRQWHEGRLKELAYPPAIVGELAGARDQWLAAIPLQQPSQRNLPE